MYKLAVTLLCLTLAGFQYRLWIADGGYAEIARLKTQIAQVGDRNGEMRTRNEALAAEIKDLKSGVAAMEGRARADLGMVGPDEQFYLLPERN